MTNSELVKTLLEGALCAGVVLLTPWGIEHLDRVTGLVWDKRELELLQREVDGDGQ